MKLLNIFSLLILILMPLTSQAKTRDYIEIVGSSTVYPFSIAVAERFGKATQYKTPKIESTGSGGGMKLFCNGIGDQFPISPTLHVELKAKNSVIAKKMV